MKLSLLIVVMLAFAIIGIAESTPSPSKNYVKVIYFHGDKRCATCQKIEKYSTEAVKKSFKNELKNGKVKWAVIDFDKDENEHYMDEYALFTQSLVVIKYKDGKQKEWKNCAKIWEKVGDESKFKKYVKDEVNKYLKAL
jgi:hypothetical protein